jgi:hypothetical protein
VEFAALPRKRAEEIQFSKVDPGCFSLRPVRYGPGLGAWFSRKCSSESKQDPRFSIRLHSHSRGPKTGPTCETGRKARFRSVVRGAILTSVSATAAQVPHQFRTRNALDGTQRTRSQSNKTAGKSTNPIDIPPLITVWLQVQVLPGPPAFARSASYGSAIPFIAKAATPKPFGRRRAALPPPPTKISTTTPCKVAGGFERSLENILTRRANQGHYSIVAHCSASAAINLPLHIRFDDGISFLVVDSAGSSHEMAIPASRTTETADYLTAPPVMPLMKRSKKRL